MLKGKYLTKSAVLISVLILYIAAITAGSQQFANITSPVIAFLSAWFLWESMSFKEYFGWNFKLLSLAAFSWGLTDTAWLYTSSILGLNPDEMPVFSYLYLATNLFLTASNALYFFKRMKRWHRVQLLLDIIVTTLVMSMCLWYIILVKFDFSTITSLNSINTLVYIITDAFCLALIFVMYSSARANGLSYSAKIVAAGVSIYALVDLYYIFMALGDTYYPNSMVDFVYMSAITVLGLAGIYTSRNKPEGITAINNSIEPENLGKSNQSALLLILPLLLYLLGFIQVYALWNLLIIIFIHMALTSYAQKNIRNEYHLKHEIQINEKLEHLIAERTQALVKTNAELDMLAKMDTLTGLYNRRYFLEELGLKVSQSRPFAIFYMDLDRFKVINDTHGHAMGDRVLAVISERLTDLKMGNALLSRAGGDEFALVVEDCTAIEEINQVAEQIIELFEQPVRVGSYIFHVGVSVGISSFPKDTQDRDQLLKYADIAMYNAKKAYNNNQYVLYNSSQSDKVERKHEIEILLRKVDFEEEFKLYYQPQLRIKDNRLIGAEALLRWYSPEKGFISPAEFIPIAEETGLILQIGQWVLRKAVEQICYWNRKYHANLVIGINISPMQMDSVDFIPDIKAVLEERQADPSWIDIEITESSAMNSNTAMEEILTALSGIGVQISIDDFGTGYSSLSYIKRFDIDRLKIAKELIDNISTDQNELLIVKAIIMMAKGMGLVTVAEGVESIEQLDILNSLECDLVQGYIKAKPQTAEEFEANFLA